MDDDSFDSFESSSENEEHYHQSSSADMYVPPATEYAGHQPVVTIIGSTGDGMISNTIPRIQAHDGDTLGSSNLHQQMSSKLAHSPKSSPKNKKKFRPHFKKPQSLGQITDKIKKRKKKVFGVNLQTAVYRSQLGQDDIELPTIFRECIDYLEENGLDHQGLYRLGGVKSQIEGIKALYDKGAIVDLSEYEVNAVASLLKLYLRELPEPLIPLVVIPQFEAIANKDASVQVDMLKQLLEDVPSCNKVLLGWLYTHFSHIADKSSINKMNISNVIIVFSPTLQIPIQIMHLLFNHRQTLFPNSEIKKYVRPQEQQSTPFDLPDPDSFETEEEITTEIVRLNDLLEKLHTKVSGRAYDERDDYCWELQRIITELKRKKKVYEQISASKLGDEQEFMKTLMVMDATLQAENDELKSRNAQLKEEIRVEAEKVEKYKSELRLYEGRERPSSPNDVEEEHQISKLLWQKRELQSQYNSLIDELAKEEKALFQARVRMKVLPIEQALAVGAE